MSRFFWYLACIGFAVLVGKVLGAVAGETLTRLLSDPGQQFNPDTGSPTFYVTQAEYFRRVASNSNICSWIGAVIGGWVGHSKWRSIDRSKYQPPEITA